MLLPKRKQCTKCGRKLPATTEFFHRQKGGKWGLNSTCKECRKRYNEQHKEQIAEYHKGHGKQYRKDNKDKIAEYHKEYYEDNKDKIVEYHKEYYENNKDKYKEYYENNKDKYKEKQRQYKERHKEEIKQYQKEYREQHKKEIAEYYEQHKKEIAEYKKQWYLDNKEQIKEYNKQWRQDNRKEIAEKKKQYYKNNPHIIFNNSIKRRSREKNQGNGITKEQWLELMEFFEWKCAYSGIQLSKDTRTVDHITPLVQGGLNEVWNCVPMYMPYNSSKKDNDMLEWYKQQEFYSEERLNKIYEWCEYAYNKWGNDEAM